METTGVGVINLIISKNGKGDFYLSTLQKKFLKKTYISYTICGKHQYILVISGEGLGVGFSMGVGLSYTICTFTVIESI